MGPLQMGPVQWLPCGMPAVVQGAALVALAIDEQHLWNEPATSLHNITTAQPLFLEEEFLEEEFLKEEFLEEEFISLLESAKSMSSVLK